MREQWCLYLLINPLKCQGDDYEWVEGIIQCFWKAGRGRRTEAPGSISGKSYGWVNKARKKPNTFSIPSCKRKKPKANPNSFICLNKGPLKGWAWAALWAQVSGVGLGRALWRDHAQACVQQTCTATKPATVASPAGIFLFPYEEIVVDFLPK